MGPGPCYKLIMSSGDCLVAIAIIHAIAYSICLDPIYQVRQLTSTKRFEYRVVPLKLFGDGPCYQLI